MSALSIGLVSLLSIALAGAEVAPQTPDDLGMLDSPEGFAQVCGELGKKIPTLDGMSETEPGDDLAKASIAMAYLNCISVVRGVAEAVGQAGEYRLHDGTRICVNPLTTIDQLLKEAIAVGSDKREVAERKLLTAPQVVLVAMLRLSKCDGEEGVQK